MKRFVLILGLCFFTIFTLLPIVLMIFLSFSEDMDFLLRGDISLTFRNYKDILFSEEVSFGGYIINSFIVSSLSACLSLLLSIPSAYAFSRFTSPFLSRFIFLFLLVTMFPPISTVGFLFQAFSILGIINTYISLIVTHAAWSLPLGVWVMYAYTEKIPKDIDRSALIDGAGLLRTVYYIILPLSKPALASAYILLFLYSFNEFLFAYMFTVDESTRTVPVGVALFEGLYGQIPWGYIMASASLSVLPVMIGVLFLQKYIIGGLTKGSVR